jgi:hypothetical protein
VGFSPPIHSFAARPTGWPYSSFRKSVALGMYQINWAIDTAEASDAGERLQHTPVG